MSWPQECDMVTIQKINLVFIHMDRGNFVTYYSATSRNVTSPHTFFFIIYFHVDLTSWTGIRPASTRPIKENFYCFALTHQGKDIDKNPLYINREVAVERHSSLSAVNSKLSSSFFIYKTFNPILIRIGEEDSCKRLEETQQSKQSDGRLHGH